MNAMQSAQTDNECSDGFEEDSTDPKAGNMDTLLDEPDSNKMNT